MDKTNNIEKTVIKYFFRASKNIHQFFNLLSLFNDNKKKYDSQLVAFFVPINVRSWKLDKITTPNICKRLKDLQKSFALSGRKLETKEELVSFYVFSLLQEWSAVMAISKSTQEQFYNVLCETIIDELNGKEFDADRWFNVFNPRFDWAYESLKRSDEIKSWSTALNNYSSEGHLLGDAVW